MNDQQLFVKMALDAWGAEIKATNALFGKLGDEQLMNEVAPSRNRGIYLLGHLATVHDRMMPLLRFQALIYPELVPVFHDAPDRAVAELPSIAELREQWKSVNETLMGHMTRLPAQEWFTRHANVSEEDFVKEPHRNRLNVVISRTNHLAYHRGQLMFLAGK